MTPRLRLSTLPDKPPARCHVEWKDGKAKGGDGRLEQQGWWRQGCSSKSMGYLPKQENVPGTCHQPPSSGPPLSGRRWQVTESAAASTSPQSVSTSPSTGGGKVVQVGPATKLPSRLFSANRWSHVALSTVPALQCRHQQRGQEQLKATTAIKYVIVSALVCRGTAQHSRSSILRASATTKIVL